MISYTLLAFFCYFFILLVIGTISHRRQSSNTEFIVGSRSLNFWLTALSAHASDMSAWLFMGLPMAVFLKGLSASWIAIGLLLGMFCTWQFIAKNLRIQTEKTKTCTLSMFFEKRFNDPSGFIRILTASLLLYYLTHYLAAGLTAMGLLMESVLKIDYYLGLGFATLVVVAYTYGGGFVTIAWTDLFQALFLLFVAMIVPLFAANAMGGFQQVLAFSESKEHFFRLFDIHQPKELFSHLMIAISWGLGYFGMPHIITKFMGIKDPKDLTKSRNLGMSWQFLALFSSIGIGIVGAAFFQGALSNPQLVFVELVKILFHPFIAGFILCGVLAANLSTMDSQLLVCASAIGEDLYPSLSRKHTPKALVRASRTGVILIALIALSLAYSKNKTIIDTVFYAWTGLGASFGPVVIMALYSNSANRFGALSGILSGSAIAMLWPSLNPYITHLEIPAIIPGFILSIAIIDLVSRITNRA